MNPGEVYAGWTLRRRLGEGGFAEVWLAERDGQEAALKILHRLDHPGLIRRFLREGRLLRRLSHPAFLQCREVVESPVPTLVLEVLYGEPLDRRLGRGPLPIKDATRIADELLSALQLLHEHGIVHRDVKPANIWLAANDRVVLMDLGLASDAADPLTSTLGEVLGTYAYMAPEQIAGGEADQRSDLYSLGVTLYEVVVGARPYQARGMAGYLAAHRSGRAIPLSKRVPGVAPRLASLVERLMARDPAARPPTAAVAAALLRGEPWPAGALQVPALVGRDGVRGAVEALLDGGGGAAGTLRLVGGPGSGLDAVLRGAITQAADAGVEHARMRLGARLSWADLCGALAFDLEPLAPDTPAEPAALAEAVRGLAAVGPSGDDVPVGFLLVVDPVDRAPPELVDWLRGLSGTPGLALLVAGRQVPAELGGFEHRLRPLRLDETRAMVASMLGTPVVPEGLDTALHAAGGGLPGWTVSVMRGLAGAGVLRCTGTDDRGVPSWTWDPERALGPIAGGTQAPFRLPLLSMRVMAAMVVAAVPLPVALVLQAVGADRSGMALGPLLRLGLLERRLHEGEEYLALRRPDVEAPLGLRLGPEARAKLARALEAAAREHPRLHPRSRERIQRLTHGAGPDTADTERLAEAIRSGDRERARELASRLPPEPEGSEGRDRQALLRAGCARLEGDPAACAQVATELRELLRGGRLPDEGLVGLVAGELEDIAASRALEGLRETPEELTRPGRLGGVWSVLPPASLGWRHAHLEAERLRRAGRPDAAIDRLRDARAQVRDPEGERWLAAVEAELRLLCGGGPALTAPPRPDPRWPVPRALAAVERVVAVDLALAQAAVSTALERASSPGGDDAWTLAADHVAGVLVSLPLLAPRDVPVEDRADPGRMPWFLRRRWLRGRALARLLVEDRPAGLDALLRGAEAARLAGDAPEQWFHEGLAGLLTAREEAVGRCMEALAEAGLPGLRAWLLALGARFTRDPEVLVAAELAAREAGDRLLLLLVLAQLRGPGAQEEAEQICGLALVGFHGPERLRFQARPEVRWACREGGI